MAVREVLADCPSELLEALRQEHNIRVKWEAALEEKLARAGLLTGNPLPPKPKTIETKKRR